MIVPKPRCQSWSKNAGGIHGRAGERTAEQNIKRDGRSDGKSSNARATAALVHRRSMNNENQKESEDRLNQNSLHRAQINRELRRSHHNHVPPEKPETNEGREKRAKNLRTPIKHRFGQCRVTAAEQTERDCRIKVAARDVQG